MNVLSYVGWFRSDGWIGKSFVNGVHRCTFVWNSLFRGSTSCEGSLSCFSNRSLEILFYVFFLSLHFWRLCQASIGETSVEGRTRCLVPGASQWGGILITLGCIGWVHYGRGRWTMASVGRALKASHGLFLCYTLSM